MIMMIGLFRFTKTRKTSINTELSTNYSFTYAKKHYRFGILNGC